MYTDKAFFLGRIKEFELDKLTESNEDNLNSAISAADSLIDSYAVNVTTVPLDSVPEIIKQFSYDIATFFLHDRIQYSDIPQRVKDKYDAALNYLKDLAQGKANLPGIAEDVIESTVQYSVNAPVMHRFM